MGFDASKSSLLAGHTSRFLKNCLQIIISNSGGFTLAIFQDDLVFLLVNHVYFLVYLVDYYKM